MYARDRSPWLMRVGSMGVNSGAVPGTGLSLGCGSVAGKVGVGTYVTAGWEVTIGAGAISVCAGLIIGVVNVVGGAPG